MGKFISMASKRNCTYNDCVHLMASEDTIKNMACFVIHAFNHLYEDIEYPLLQYHSGAKFPQFAPKRVFKLN